MGKQVLLVGATGLVGRGVLNVLLEAPDIARVTALVRRPLAITHPKLRVQQIAEFSAAVLAGLDLHGLDACLYCAGPLPLGMGEAAYREATVGTLERVVQAYARANPEGYVAYVSGMGADPGSRLMPLRVKGEAEAVLARCGLQHTSLRPGVVRPVDGVCSPHRMRGLAYRLGDPLLALAARLAPAIFTTTTAIGDCMLRLVLAAGPRPAVIENADIARLGGE
ncbi:MAG: NAD(P)H-binding protein [Xanthomonadales bacterium]|nr:NAD(P)H-binding protein [Xanthomonadales bacterium]MBN8794833.1 NAD(P)H-binding protein [Stenotrophomonas nitritireducens]